MGLPDNLALYRKGRDLSQEQLAEAAAVSVDTVARIERGVRTTSRPATLSRLACALGITVERLLGQEFAPFAPPDLGPLRRAITGGEHIAGLSDFAEDAETVSAKELALSAHRAWRAYVDGRHTELLHALPSVLTDARRLVHATSGDQQAAGYRILSTSYRLGAGIAGRFDLDDLAWTSAERALAAARRSDAPEVEAAISMRYLAWTLVRQGRVQEAERVATSAAEKIAPRRFDRDPTRAGVFGNLLFNAATAALLAGSPARADDLLAEADAAAARSRVDSATEAAIFGPRVVALQRIDFLARAGDPEAAMRRAAMVSVSHGEVPAFWEAGHQLRLAAAAVDLRRDQQALTLLGEARGLAPDWVRHQPLGKATMRRLVDRAARRRGDVFASLAAHYGVVPT